MLKQCERQIARTVRTENVVRTMPLQQAPVAKEAVVVAQDNTVRIPGLSAMFEQHAKDKPSESTHVASGRKKKRGRLALRGGIDGKTCAIVLTPKVHAALAARAKARGTSVKEEVLNAVMLSVGQ